MEIRTIANARRHIPDPITGILQWTDDDLLLFCTNKSIVNKYVARRSTIHGEYLAPYLNYGEIIYGARYSLNRPYHDIQKSTMYISNSRKPINYLWK